MTKTKKSAKANGFRRWLKRMPWESGNEGWDNYADFELWLANQFGEECEDWVCEAPTSLMKVFVEFAYWVKKNG
uniref:Uncharacterized protein n=1 Tax=viral metagenome TaxID=1070528 RepID=A0A6M3LNT6_9ZZZZ